MRAPALLFVTLLTAAVQGAVLEACQQKCCERGCTLWVAAGGMCPVKRSTLEDADVSLQFDARAVEVTAARKCCAMGCIRYVPSTSPCPV